MVIGFFFCLGFIVEILLLVFCLGFIDEILLRWWQKFSIVICGSGVWLVAGLLVSGYD